MIKEKVMPLDDTDREWARAIAREIAAEVIDTTLPKIINNHINSCPHGKFIATSKWFAIGICIGSGAAGGGIALALAKVVVGI